MKTGDGQHALIAYNVWLAYDAELKTKLAKLFAIPRTGESVVHNSGMENGRPVVHVTSDGYTPVDLKALSTERMQELLGTTSDDFYKLIDTIIKNVDALIAGTYKKPAPRAPARPKAPKTSKPAPTA